MVTSHYLVILGKFFIFDIAGVLGKAIPFVLPIITRLITDPVVSANLNYII